MRYRSILACIIGMSVSLSLRAQISQDAKYDLLRTVLADTAAARVALPFGEAGVELTDSGQINKDKLDREMRKNGQSIEVGKVVTVTSLSFSDDKIEVELDGGGKNKKNFLDRIQVGVGTGNTNTHPVGNDDKIKKAKGSKIILRFEKKVPPDLTAEQLKKVLDPILDFNKRSFMKTGIDALPPEFQDAVKAKEARIGMDRSTVIMALGRPDQKVREAKNGAMSEQWIYYLRGVRTLFVTFEDDSLGSVVVEIKQY